MPLTSQEVMLKANKKGFIFKANPDLISPWKQESILYNKNIYSEEETPGKETSGKVDANQLQSRCKVDANQLQSRCKPVANIRKLDAKWLQSDSETSCKVDANQLQSRCKVDAKNGFSSSVGVQRAVLVFMYFSCKAYGNKETGQLTLKQIASALNTLETTVKSAIYRLESNGCIQRVGFKNGRGGWTRYGLLDSVYEEILQHENDGILGGITSGKVDATATLVSSKFLNTTTNQEEEKKGSTNIPKDWSDIDYSMIEGFNEARLIQIYRAYQKSPSISLSPDIIQESINHLAFDLKYNDAKSKIREPLAMLVSLLKRGEPYTTNTPSSYISPRDAALRKYHESQALIASSSKELEDKLFHDEQKAWLRSFMTDQESFVKRFCSPDMLKCGWSETFESASNNAKEYFTNTIWPVKWAEILAST